MTEKKQKGVGLDTVLLLVFASFLTGMVVNDAFIESQHVAAQPKTRYVSDNQLKQWNINLSQMAYSIFLSDGCKRLLAGQQQPENSDQDIIISTGRKTRIILDKTAQKLLTKIRQGKIVSVNDLIMSASLNDRNMNHAQLDYLVKTLKKMLNNKKDSEKQ